MWHVICLYLQNQLTDNSNVVDYLMEQPNVVPRMNGLILSSDRKYLDFTATPGDVRYSTIQYPFIFYVDLILSLFLILQL